MEKNIILSNDFIILSIEDITPINESKSIQIYRKITKNRRYKITYLDTITNIKYIFYEDTNEFS